MSSPADFGTHLLQRALPDEIPYRLALVRQFAETLAQLDKPLDVLATVILHLSQCRKRFVEVVKLLTWGQDVTHECCRSVCEEDPAWGREDLFFSRGSDSGGYRLVLVIVPFTLDWRRNGPVWTVERVRYTITRQPIPISVRVRMSVCKQWCRVGRLLLRRLVMLVECEGRRVAEDGKEATERALELGFVFDEVASCALEIWEHACAEGVLNRLVQYISTERGMLLCWRAIGCDTWWGRCAKVGQSRQRRRRRA